LRCTWHLNSKHSKSVLIIIKELLIVTQVLGQRLLGPNELGSATHPKVPVEETDSDADRKGSTAILGRHRDLSSALSSAVLAGI
jgi:hypothetical protein